MESFVRTGLLIGEDGLKKLEKAKIAIFGIGGVGGYVAEALARSGIGSFLLVDKDVVGESNINRQIIATVKTIGKLKTELMKGRMLDINPQAEIEVRNSFFLPENAGDYDFAGYDYIIDAVDTVTAKIELAVKAKEAGTKIISSMGAGNKLDPARFEVADIYETSVCPLARAMRRELKKRGIGSLKVVYSKEEALIPKKIISDESKRVIPGSIAFVPSAAGLVLAGEVVRDLLRA